MTMIKTAVPLLLLTSVLTGCAGLQKTDWPICAAAGGVGGAALGSIQSAAVAGTAGIMGAAIVGGYCWVHGDGDDDHDGVPNSRDKCPGTPPNTPVDANGCPPEPVPAPPVAEAPAPAPMPKQETIVVRDVLFEFNKAVLTANDKTKLNSVASRLKNEAPTAKLSVSGHTDSVGSDAYNKKLSQKRAQAVVDYLVSTGLDRASFVSVVGDGESMPVADNKTAEGRALNRRVEIQIDR